MRIGYTNGFGGKGTLKERPIYRLAFVKIVWTLELQHRKLLILQPTRTDGGTLFGKWAARALWTS